MKPDLKHISCPRLKLLDGFSLMELLVVMAIAGIVMTIAWPNFARFMDREQVAALSDEFAMALGVARSNAIKAGIPVHLCASSDGEACGGRWADGWLAFRDDNRDAALSGTDTMVLRRNNNLNSVVLSVSSLAGETLDMIDFNYRGAPNSALLVSITRGSENHSMTITPFGKARHHD